MRRMRRQENTSTTAPPPAGADAATRSPSVDLTEAWVIASLVAVILLAIAATVMAEGDDQGWGDFDRETLREDEIDVDDSVFQYEPQPDQNNSWLDIDDRPRYVDVYGDYGRNIRPTRGAPPNEGDFDYGSDAEAWLDADADLPGGVQGRGVPEGVDYDRGQVIDYGDYEEGEDARNRMWIPREDAQRRAARRAVERTEARTRGRDQQPTLPADDVGQPMPNSSAVTVRGQVLATRGVSMQGVPSDHHLIRLRSDDGQRLVVDLGSREALRKDLRLQKGERIAVRGSTGQMDGTPILYARQVADTYTIDREPTGLEQRQGSRERSGADKPRRRNGQR